MQAHDMSPLLSLLIYFLRLEFHTREAYMLSACCFNTFRGAHAAGRQALERPEQAFAADISVNP